VSAALDRLHFPAIPCSLVGAVMCAVLLAPPVALAHITPHRSARSARAHLHPRAARHTTARQASGAATPVGVLAPTPYMGWDTYFAFGSHYNEATVLEQASQMRTKGLIKDGYDYLWLDVGWWEGTRNAAGEITVNPKQWPHGMAWLARTLHEAGLKVGLYTDAGTNGCGGKGQGSYGHYQQDLNTFAKWGFDAVKVDFCGGIQQGLNPASAYAEFHEAIVHNSGNRPMLLSVCDYLQPGQYESEVPTLENSAFNSYTFGPSVGNSWRTDTDVGVPGDVEFSSVLRNLDADAAQPEAAGPGHWNDPDYLGPDQGMSAAQFRTQFSMWAMLAAPLMISEDLISMSSATHTTVTNREAIAIDQDPAGQQARLLSSSGSGEVWVKPLANGTHAVALLNRSSKTLELTTSAAAVGMPAANAYQLRNVWSGAVTSTTSGIGASVPGESTVLLRVSTAAQAIEAVPKRQG
jgi:alpha-galactosidase